MNWQEMLAQNSIAIFVFGSIVYLLTQQLKKKEMSLSDYMHDLVENDMPTLLLIVIVGTYSAEAVFAFTAKLQEHHHHANMTARAISHGLVSFFSLLALLFAAVKSSKFFKIMFSWDNAKNRTGKWVTSSLIGILLIGASIWATIFLPYLNYGTITQANGETVYGDILVKSYIFFWMDWSDHMTMIENELIAAGKHIRGAPFALEDHLQHTTVLSANVIRIHMVALAFDILLHINNRFGVDASVSTVTASATTNPQTLFKWIIRNISNISVNIDVNNRASQMMDGYNRLSAQKKAELLQLCTEFKTNFENASSQDEKFRLAKNINDRLGKSSQNGGVGNKLGLKNKSAL